MKKRAKKPAPKRGSLADRLNKVQGRIKESKEHAFTASNWQSETKFEKKKKQKGLK